MGNRRNVVKDMTQGNPFRLILFFSLPLMLGNVFQQLYTFVDALIVGQKIGPYAMAALGATEWITFIVFGVVQGVTQGCSVIVSKYFGNQKQELLEKSIFNMYFISGVLAICFTVIGQIVIYPGLLLLNTPVEILDFAHLYLKILYAGIPVTVLYNMLAAIMRALGNSRQPLNAMIIASIGNIVLDLLFIVGFNLGIAGAAYATVLSQIFACLYCLYFIKRTKMYQLHKVNRVVVKDIVKEQIILAMPMGVQNIITAVGGLVVQATVNSFGVLFVTGYAAANKLYALLEIAATSYAQGSLTFTAQNRGNGNKRRIKEGLAASLLIGCITALLMSCIMMIAGEWILGLFITDTEVEIEGAIQIGYQFLKILALGFPLLYGLYVIRACIQGLGNSFFPMLSSFIQVIMRVSCALLLTKQIGYYGIFWGELCAWIGADVFLAFIFCFLIKKKRTLKK